MVWMVWRGYKACFDTARPLSSCRFDPKKAFQHHHGQPALHEDPLVVRHRPPSSAATPPGAQQGADEEEEGGEDVPSPVLWPASGDVPR